MTSGNNVNVFLDLLGQRATLRGLFHGWHTLPALAAAQHASSFIPDPALQQATHHRVCG